MIGFKVAPELLPDCDECGQYKCRESNSDTEMIFRHDLEGNLVDIRRGPIEQWRETCKKALTKKPNG